jgi:YidC/Oxa1 family membrane protein insertase
MGLDYGHGPTGMMEWVLEHVHVLAGTPWWASIALTALIVRIACLYPNFMGTDNAAKMAIVAPLAKPLMEKMKDASRLGDTAETMRIRAELQMMNKRAGVKYWKALVPLLQAPIGFGTFFLLRGMANLPVPGLETGGILWFTNLTIPDPFFILPMATAGVLHFVLRVSIPLLPAQQNSHPPIDNKTKQANRKAAKPASKTCHPNSCAACPTSSPPSP